MQGQCTASPNNVERPIPFEIAIEAWPKRQLIDGTIYQLRQVDRCREHGAETGAVEAERHCDLLWQEVDRRERIAAEREARKLARLRAKADALLAAKQ